ncbi:MAG: nucleotidyltransferase domain-containing protein [Candidatus Hodarchaeota archaeon]
MQEIIRDGDAIISKHNLVFYAFGYEHPQGNIIAFLKYVPNEYKRHFRISWLEYNWEFEGISLVRPSELYSPRTYSAVIEGLKSISPDYSYEDKIIAKPIIVVPRRLIRRIFFPYKRLQHLLNKKNLDPLEKKAVNLIKLLSDESGTSITDFGIHGSISLGMHTEKSDIDISVYGAKNFRRVKRTVAELDGDGLIVLSKSNPIERVRCNRGFYEEKNFVFNATRKNEEITDQYGSASYKAIKPLKFSCKVVNADEAMFRPAKYHIEDYIPLNRSYEIEEKPKTVVSMIGEFRDIAKAGDRIEVHGMLERVEGKRTTYRVVIGSGFGKEYIWPENLE